MRFFHYPRHGLMAAVSLCLIGFAERSAFRAEEPRDPFQPNTVWKGEIVYNKTDYAPQSKPFPMILYVKQRKGADFQALLGIRVRRTGCS